MNRAFRLLPAVVVVGLGLLALKGVDIARASSAAVDLDEPDNSGLAPTNFATKLPSKDFAGEDAAAGSTATVDVMGSLTRRRTELDARERALDMRENVLKAGETRMDQKIADIKALQAQMQSLLDQRDAKQDAQIASLVKTYSAMKPKDAARIFNSLSDTVLLPVAKGMKPDVMAPVLAAMNSDAAQRLTEKLAALLKLPESASTVCPASADQAPPATNASAVITPADPIPAAMLTPPPIAATIVPDVKSAPPTVTPPAPSDKPHKPEPRHITKPLAASLPPPPKATTLATTSKPDTSTPAPPIKAVVVPDAKPASAAQPTPPAPVSAPAASGTTTSSPPQAAASAPPTPLIPAKSN